MIKKDRSNTRNNQMINIFLGGFLVWTGSAIIDGSVKDNTYATTPVLGILFVLFGGMILGVSVNKFIELRKNHGKKEG